MTPDEIDVLCELTIYLLLLAVVLHFLGSRLGAVFELFTPYGWKRLYLARTARRLREGRQ